MSGGIHMRVDMKTKLIGRKEEQTLLDLAYKSDKPEFLALHGRRRVGKTFLIRCHFEEKKESIFFNATGMEDGTTAEQISNFTEEIGEAFLYPGARLGVKKNWRDTFSVLTDTIKATPTHKKIVLFFDEFPWMVAKRSRLLQVLEYYWNHHWSKDPRIKLIICGSASGWILKNIINNKGGLYNRVTRTLCLEPFDLKKTKQYLNYSNIKLNHKQIASLYMVLGGIPFYLSQIDPGLSAHQIIEKLAFRKDSFLLKEFDSLYATLFGTEGVYVELVRTMAQYRYGIGQEELANKIQQLSSGGRIVSRLEELEQAGFIARFKPFSHKKKGIYYKVIDEYTLFYFNWIEPIKESLLSKGMRKGYWQSLQDSSTWHTWTGYAFEALCYKHLVQISAALELNPTAIPYTWRHIPKNDSQKSGAQIDLLFDRNDGVISLCEIKNTSQPFVIDKQYAEKLKKKMEAFREITRTKKQLFLAMISAAGLKKTMYSEEMISQIVSLDDLFREVL